MDSEKTDRPKSSREIIDKGLTIAHDASEGARLWMGGQAMIDRHYIKSEISTDKYFNPKSSTLKSGGRTFEL
jgi:hypothetical protein